jgi:hypothetical protein
VIISVKMKANSGLSLTELLIAVIFLGVVVLSAVSIDIAANRSLLSERSQVKVGAEAAVILERIIKDIQLAFGFPIAGREAFSIKDAGRTLELRREDVAPTGPDVNDRWVGYHYDDANHVITYNPDLTGAGSYTTIARNITGANVMFQAIDADTDGNPLNDNLIRIEITIRQDPAQPSSLVNPEAIVTTTVGIFSVSSR